MFFTLSPPSPFTAPPHMFLRSRVQASYIWMCVCVCVEKLFAVLTLRQGNSNRNNNTSRKTWKIVFDLNFVVGFSSFRFLLAVHIKDLSKQTLTKHLFNVFKYVERTQSKIDSSCWARLLLWLPEFFKRNREREGERQCVHKYFICLAVV